MAENPNAFPFSAEYGHPAACGGMTLRDWFAGQALTGVIACSDKDLIHDIKNGIRAGRSVAITTYRIADAMLLARSKETDNG